MVGCQSTPFSPPPPPGTQGRLILPASVRLESLGWLRSTPAQPVLPCC